MASSVSSRSGAKRASKRHAASSRRMPVGSPSASRSTTPPGVSRSPPASASAARVQPQRVAVVRAQRDRDVGRDRVERRRRGRSPAGHSSSRQPRPRIQPPADGAGARDPRHRLGERARVEQGELAPGERPGREVHVRVGEAGQHAAAREVDALGAARRVGGVVEHGGDAVAGEQQRAPRPAAPGPSCASSRRAGQHARPNAHATKTRTPAARAAVGLAQPAVVVRVGVDGVLRYQPDAGRRLGARERAAQHVGLRRALHGRRAPLRRRATNASRQPPSVA